MDEIMETDLAGITNPVTEKAKPEEFPVAVAAEPVEADPPAVAAKPKPSRKNRKTKATATKETGESAKAVPENKEKDNSRKSRKAKAGSSRKNKKEVNQITEDLPTGQGKVQQVRVQVNNKKTVKNCESAVVDAESRSEMTSFDTESIVSEIQPPLTNQVKVASVQSVPLPFRAVKVRNVVGEVVNLVTEVIPNKVIVQGTVHEQLFFVGTDGIVHHRADDIPFSTFVDIPGAQPGMNTQVTAVIEKIIPELAPDGLSVVKKVIIEVFLKVTETVQVNFLPGTGPLLLLKEVVGENTNQLLLENEFTLATAAVKVDEIVGRIQDLEVEVIKDKVIIQGILHKQIFFVSTDNLGRHQGEEVPFSLFVDLPGAEPGMDVQVQPRIEAILFELVTPVMVRQKAVLEFFVKVTENFRQNVTVGAGPLFKVEELIGENTVQELSETLITLPVAALKVREIIAQVRELTTHVITDKVIVQGTIHKQIFFISNDDVERHQAEDIPFSLFLDIPGATPGDTVKVKPLIEAVFFKLESATQLRQKVIIAINAIVTRELQLNLVLSAGPLFKVEQVVGEGTKQVLALRREEIVPPQPVQPVTVTENIIVIPKIVAGEQQIMLRNLVKLPVKAIKVKEIHAKVDEVSSRAIEAGVVIEGIIEKVLSFVSTDNIVRSQTERVPFSILVNVPGISPDQPAEVEVEIENISFELDAAGDTVTQVIVLRATVSAGRTPDQQVTVVTDVQGPGVVQTKVRVRALVLLPSGQVEQREFDVVTEVSGPGIAGTEKRVLMLDVVGDGNPNPVPVTVVTRVILE